MASDNTKNFTESSKKRTTNSFLSVRKSLDFRNVETERENTLAAGVTRSALNYGGAVLSAIVPDPILKASNLGKISLDTAKKLTLFSRVTGGVIDYPQAMRDLGEGIGKVGEPQKDPTVSNLRSIKKELPLFPTIASEYNVLDIDKTRGCLIPTYLFENKKINPKDFFFFQYNPTEFEDKKKNNVVEKNYLGFGASRNNWVFGGRRTMSFNLFFDASRISMNEDELFSAELREQAKNPYSNDKHAKYGGDSVNGTQPVVDRLCSFQYPIIQKKELEGLSRPRYYNGMQEPAPRFESIPQLYLILGNRVFMGKIDSVGVKHVLHNKDYMPIRSECSVSFIIDEWDVHSDFSKPVLEKYRANINPALINAAIKSISEN